MSAHGTGTLLARPARPASHASPVAVAAAPPAGPGAGSGAGSDATRSAASSAAVPGGDSSGRLAHLDATAAGPVVVLRTLHDGAVLWRSAPVEADAPGLFGRCSGATAQLALLAGTLLTGWRARSALLDLPTLRHLDVSGWSLAALPDLAMADLARLRQARPGITWMGTT